MRYRIIVHTKSKVLEIYMYIADVDFGESYQN